MNGSAVHLRAAAEPPALQLSDQKPQLLDLGLGHVTLGTNGISLGQGSSVFDLQRCQRGILPGNDFRHLLQMTKQLIGVS